MLDFQNLEVYRNARELLRLVGQVTDCFGGGDLAVCDQLRGAAQQIPLQIADACFPVEGDDPRMAYDRARGAAFRCAALFDVCRELGLIHAKRYAEAVVLVEQVVAGLAPPPP